MRIVFVISLFCIGFAEMALSQEDKYDDAILTIPQEQEDTYYENGYPVLSERIEQQSKSRAFKPNLKSRYNDQDFDYTEDPIAVNESNINPNERVFVVIGNILKVLGYLVLIIIVALVIRAFVVDGGILTSKGKKIKGLYEIVDDQLNFEEHDYLSHAQEASKLGEWKLAVRYFFLAYLQQLNANKIIDFHRDKTNREYRYEIVDVEIRNEFNVICRVFDYCWYGERDLSEQQFRNAEQIFKSSLKK